MYVGDAVHVYYTFLSEYIIITITTRLCGKEGDVFFPTIIMSLSSAFEKELFLFIR